MARGVLVVVYVAIRHVVRLPPDGEANLPKGSLVLQ